MDSKGQQKKKEKKLPEFQPSLPPDNVHNLEAARARRLTFDRESEVYRDEDGFADRDKFGQPWDPVSRGLI
ncbi:MAG: hypothetical protein KJI72_00480 [Patescibacteria group bacterium]|nr:hypothetical protein [Patescibacteria group bacterium]